MARISFKGFKDPVTRPRYIIWALVAVLIIAGVMIPVLGVTSTRWFCAEGCHKVQDDTITAYEHSAHSEISCMACHMPVAANPVIFLIHKAEALGELAQTVTGSYELPLNAESEVALTMTEDQCTQCHNLKTRKVTPSPGIKINHQIHADKEVSCPLCHNRTAHVEDFALTLKNPKTGEPSKKHQDFMMMTACFRCHSQDASGLPRERRPRRRPRPARARRATRRASSSSRRATRPPASCRPVTPSSPRRPTRRSSRPAARHGSQSASGETSAQVEGGREGPNGPGTEEGIGPELKTVEQINECSTCHAKKFCIDCHGLPMPHPPTFKKEHGKLGTANPNLCAKCHGNATTFCNECHHGSAMDVPYNAAVPWMHEPPDRREPGRRIGMLRVPQPDVLRQLPRERSRASRSSRSDPDPARWGRAARTALVRFLLQFSRRAAAPFGPDAILPGALRGLPGTQRGGTAAVPFRGRTYDRKGLAFMQKVDLVLLHAPSVYDFRERSIMFGPVSDMVPSTPDLRDVSARLHDDGRVHGAPRHPRAHRQPRGAHAQQARLRRRGLHRASSNPVAFGIDLHWLPHAHGSIEIARIVKKHHPDTPVIFGGLSSSYFHEELITYDARRLRGARRLHRGADDAPA